MARLRRGFGVVATAVALDPSISTMAKSVYLVLACHAGEDGECWISNASIAEGVGASTRTVIRALNELLDAGVIERDERYEDGRQTTSITRLLDATTASRGDAGDTLVGDPSDTLVGDPDVTQNKTTMNKTTRNKDLPPPDGVEAQPPNVGKGYADAWEQAHGTKAPTAAIKRVARDGKRLLDEGQDAETVAAAAALAARSGHANITSALLAAASEATRRPMYDRPQKQSALSAVAGAIDLLNSGYDPFALPPTDTPEVTA